MSGRLAAAQTWVRQDHEAKRTRCKRAPRGTSGFLAVRVDDADPEGSDLRTFLTGTSGAGTSLKAAERCNDRIALARGWASRTLSHERWYLLAVHAKQNELASFGAGWAKSSPLTS